MKIDSQNGFFSRTGQQEILCRENDIVFYFLSSDIDSISSELAENGLKKPKRLTVHRTVLKNQVPKWSGRNKIFSRA